MRALIVTNMYPSPANPARGRFVYDQVNALRALDGLEVELYAFTPGRATAYLDAARDLRRRHRGGGFEVVHAHFGLTAWPARAVPAAVHAVTLHGTDLANPRSRVITLAALPWLDLVAAVSAELATQVPRWAVRRPPQVLPCGVDLGRFRRIERDEARSSLGLDPDRRYLLFPADPARPEKRYDLAVSAAGAVGGTLLTLGAVHPDRVPLFVNAADAVLVPSDREGFGLAVLEALACDVPVLATPHGVAPSALDGIQGTLCAPFSLPEWGDALAAVLAQPDPRIAGRDRAQLFSADVMARGVASAWRQALHAR